MKDPWNRTGSWATGEESEWSSGMRIVDAISETFSSDYWKLLIIKYDTSALWCSYKRQQNFEENEGSWHLVKLIVNYKVCLLWMKIYMILGHWLCIHKYLL